MRGFYSDLFKRGDDLLPRGDLIDAPGVRRAAATLAARTVASTHRHVHVLLQRDGSGYTDPCRTILVHTPEEVDTLLGVSSAG